MYAAGGTLQFLHFGIIKQIQFSSEGLLTQIPPYQSEILNPSAHI